MEHKKNLLYGIVAGVLLLFLNNSIAFSTIKSLFDSMPIAYITVRCMLYILSFIGILTVAFCSIELIIDVHKFRKQR
ncbi:hypothetical protein P5G65_15655 [Paenibacillus chondroitinus]|uniref:Uncharacterized protein n=1 Tax=Paenibacillus chondroitinus TaxID=59842 RepID=A0ABU6DC63_9BACL|nr:MULTISPECIES: hypothetical protein [Paenibacillus]MCY9656517.1 hypothetical protein [Paenibacillus anseongense]MEB4795341.1 hypothetical protein [Paenibacillus chondroitinus]